MPDIPKILEKKIYLAGWQVGRKGACSYMSFMLKRSLVSGLDERWVEASESKRISAASHHYE
jgi:hypothetical protein